jgi:hypothetical protein
MNRIAVRVLLLLSVVYSILAAYYSVQAQWLRWPDAEPGTSKIQWYGSVIMPYVVWALALGFAAIRPDKTGGTVLIVAAALFCLATMMTVATPPASRHMNFLMMAIPLFIVGITLRRMAPSQQA